MFVEVGCSNCGKLFRVPESALGQIAPCPWCQAVVTALPVAAPLGQAAPQPAGAAEPLSLDDEPAPTEPVKPPAAPASRAKLLLMVGVGALILLVAMAATLVVRGYGSGRVPEYGWVEFTAPDGSFTVSLPGQPAEEELAGDPANSVGTGKRFATRGWYSKTSAWVAYRDLDPALVQKLPADKDRVFAAGVLRAERERERARLGGTVTKEAEVRLNSAWGVELQMDTPGGTVIEWLLLQADGPHPRLFTLGVQAKEITPESRACRRLFASFRVNN